MKRALSLLIGAAILMGCLTGCGTAPAVQQEPSKTPAATSDPMKVAIVVCSPDEYMTDLINGATEACKAIGAEIKAYTPNSETEIMQQVQMVEDAISSGIDVLLLSPLTTDSCLNVLRTAKDEGVTVVLLGKTVDPSFTDYVTFIGTSEDQASREGAKAFCESLEPNSRILYIRGKLGDQTHDTRTNAMVETFEAAGHTILEIQDADSDAEKGAAVMEDYIQKYGDDGFDAIAVSSDAMAVGAIQSLKQAGITGKKVMGYDGFASAIELVKSGDMVLTVKQQPYLIAQTGVDIAVRARDGEAFEKVTSTPVVVIDSNNVDEYL